MAIYSSKYVQTACNKEIKLMTHKISNESNKM